MPNSIKFQHIKYRAKGEHKGNNYFENSVHWVHENKAHGKLNKNIIYNIKQS